MGKVNSVNRSFMSVRQLSTAGLLVGITIFLGISGYGFIPSHDRIFLRHVLFYSGFSLTGCDDAVRVFI